MTAKQMHAESDRESSEEDAPFCGCPVCETALLCRMVHELSVSGQELMRSAFATMFAGRTGVRCLR